MSNPISRSVRRLSSRITAIWLSVLSWMRWRRNRRARETEYLQVLDRLMVAQVQSRKELRQFRVEQEEAKQLLLDSLHSQLMAALRPMADAMLRQDSLAETRHDQQQELLMEVLSSLQPTAQEQISQRIGLPPPTPSSPSLAS